MSRRSGRGTVGLAVMVILSATGCFGGKGNVFSLKVGQCFDDPDVVAAEIIDVIIVDCSSPHDNEVYAAFDLAGTAFPGVDEVFDAAHRGCEDRFSAYVGEPLAAGALAATFLAPTEQSWDNSDDREVICYLLDRRGAPLRGPMRGTGTGT